MQNFRSVLKTLLFTPTPHGWGIPALFQGAPGIGKTSQAYTLTTLGLPVYVLIGSTCDPTDVRGLQVVDAESGTAFSASPAWVRYLQDRGGLVLLDEFNQSPPSMQAAMLRMINERAYGEHDLGHRVRFLAVQNPAKQARGAWSISQPMANRFCHLDWAAPNADAWADYMLTSPALPRSDIRKSGLLEADPAAAIELEAWVSQRFPEVLARYTMAMIGFVRAQPQILATVPKDGETAWPTARSIEYATRAMAGAEVFGLAADDTGQLVNGLIGPAASLQFATWRHEASLPDARALLEGSINWKPGARIDVNFAVASGVTAAYLSSEGTKLSSRWAKIMCDIADINADVVVKPLANVNKAMKLGSLTDPSWVAIVRKMKPYLDAGLIREA